MSLVRWLGCCGVLLVFAHGAAHAQTQFVLMCDSGSTSELKQNIQAHEEHISRLYKKLVTGWYWQGPLPKSFKAIELADVRDRLAQMAPRKAAVLFYAYSEEQRRLCIWLISATEPDVSVVLPLVSINELLSLRPRLIAALGTETRSRPVRRGEMSAQDFEEQMAALDRELDDLASGELPERQIGPLARMLLPEKLVGEIEERKVDTLIVMPVFDLGVIPFAALPIGENRMLIDVVSITVAPGFFVFRETQRSAKHDFAGALVVGNPYREDPEWHHPRLPGAEAEAREIAALERVKPLIGVQATKTAILDRLGRRPGPPLIYFATHGIADAANPLEGGFLELSDGHWTGRDIVRQVPRGSVRPLVVLSACQTGLGKHFEVGTIGIARAWHEVGAANVVMSLWLVGDRATQALMTQFIKFAAEAPPDQALRQAMLERRREDPRVTAWASFAIFGAPER